MPQIEQRFLFFKKDVHNQSKQSGRETKHPTERTKKKKPSNIDDTNGCDRLNEEKREHIERKHQNPINNDEKVGDKEKIRNACI